jgi:alpha-tubulin suppressor-like RCC1 family protein
MVFYPFEISSYSLGNNHTLLVDKNKNLWTTGGNTHGQLGDGANVDINSPSTGGTLSGFFNNTKAVSAGSFFSSAVTNEGWLEAWGKNHTNQLGDGTTVDGNTPSRIGSSSDWVDVSSGAYHALAINSAGEIYGWGNNFYGAIGDGTNINRTTPVRVGSSNNWVKVSAGSGVSFAINSSGELYGWGYNTDGCLGDGTNTDKNTPIRIGSSSNWVDIKIKNFSALALNSAGEIYTWGLNSKGQLGDGTNVNSRNTPTVFPGIVVGAATWASIAVGSDHCFAIDISGNLYAWGGNFYGQLGDGTNDDKNTPTLIGSGWVHIEAGGFFSIGHKCNS